MSLIYLASPYSSADEQLRQCRHDAVAWYVAKCIRAGQHVLSPICHSHPLVRFGAPGESAAWEAWNRELQCRCNATTVLCLPGWIDSEGVTREREYGHELKHPVRLVVNNTANAIAEGKFHRNGGLQIERVKRWLDKETETS